MKKYIGAALLALLIVAMMIPTVAWFGTLVKLDYNPPISGSTGAAFFAGGDGSVDSPYIINEPVHLYNMAWLQYIGYFNLNPASNNGRAQSYFKVTADLDMSDMSALPPIGTTQYPFHGNFDGGSCVISNLTTANLNSAAGGLITEWPNTAEFIEASKLLEKYGTGTDEAGQIMGFFGVIGDYNNSMQAVAGLGTDIQISEDTPPTAEEESANNGALHEDNMKILYTQAITAKDFALVDYTVQTDSQTTTVGLAAGYVNAKLEKIGVSDGSIAVTKAIAGKENTANVSDYALVGYCSPAYRVEGNAQHTVTVYEPWEGEGKQGSLGNDGEGWGGSMDMYSLARRLTYMYSENVKQNNNYPASFAATAQSSASVMYQYRIDYTATSAMTNYLTKGTALPLNVDTASMFVGSDSSYQGENATRLFYTNDYYKSHSEEIVLSTNTGYIVGGGTGTGDAAIRFRINKLAYGTYSGIYRSIGTEKNSSATFSRSSLQVLTIAPNGTTYVISDANGGSDTAAAADKTSQTPAQLNLYNYASVVEAFSSSLSQNNGMIYGLRFFKGQSETLSSSNTTTTAATGTLYNGQQLIDGAINFKVGSIGSVTTIAGTYAEQTGDHNLFSLYKVSRNLDGSIDYANTFLIKKIWVKRDSKNAITEVVYNDNGSTAAGYMLAYDRSKMNTLTEINVAYYFEFPVAPGDYILTSLDSDRGAYLLYLDVGANAGTDDVEEADFEQFTEVYEVNLENTEYAGEVVLLPDGTRSYPSADDFPDEYYAVLMQAGFNGTLTLSNANGELTYQPSDSTLLMPQSKPVSKIRTIRKTLTVPSTEDGGDPTIYVLVCIENYDSDNQLVGSRVVTATKNGQPHTVTTNSNGLTTVDPLDVEEQKDIIVDWTKHNDLTSDTTVVKIKYEFTNDVDVSVTYTGTNVFSVAFTPETDITKVTIIQAVKSGYSVEITPGPTP